MPTRCCVPGCATSGGHKFPKDVDLHMKWRVAIKRSDEKKGIWKPGPNDVVCHQHFIGSDYNDTLLDEKCILKKNAVPSVFPFCKKKWDDFLSPRASRMQARVKATEEIIQQSFDQGIQQEIEIMSDDVCCITKEEIIPTEEDKEIQCQLIGRYSIENFILNTKAVLFYTGFKSFEHFMFLFNCLGPAAYDLNYKCANLTPQDQLFLTLIKLRFAKEDIELSFLFHISESTVARIFNTWVNFLHFQLNDLNIWPSRKVVDECMPSDFHKKFPTTRVILDATEMPIQKPKDVNIQSLTWSSYKHKNTIKTMVGCTPRGAVSFVSDCYGGSVSDRQIIEDSNILDNSMFDSGDSIMADRGIMVQDLFANQNVCVNTPTMLKGKSQLEPEEIIRDRRVASKHIHIERVIGLTKKFKILRTDLSNTKLPLANRIVNVCFRLTNFKNVIVDKFA